MASSIKRIAQSGIDTALQTMWVAVFAVLCTAMIATMVWLLGHFKALQAIWIDRAQGALVACIAIGSISAALVLVRRRTKRVAFGTYLWQLAQADSRNMWRQMVPYWSNVHAFPHLDAQEPFVDLRVEFVNATVFELTLDRVQGRIQYRDNLLQRAPEIVNGGVARHGEWFTVDVRQWLLPETAQRMRDELPVTLKTGNCAFMFRFEDETGAAQTMRCAFPDGIFRVSKS